MWLSESYIQLPPDSTGKKVRAFYQPSTGTYEEVQVSKNIEYLNPVYVVSVSGSAVSANKHHLLIWNGSTYRLRVLKIVASIHATTTVTGFPMQFMVYRVVSVSGQPSILPQNLDPDDPYPPSGLEIFTGVTATITGAPLAIFVLNPEDTGGNHWIDFTPPKPIVIKPSTGLTIQQYGTAGTGLFNASIYFSVEYVKP
jgi:hypothetical protein